MVITEDGVFDNRGVDSFVKEKFLSGVKQGFGVMFMSDVDFLKFLERAVTEYVLHIEKTYIG